MEFNTLKEQRQSPSTASASASASASTSTSQSASSAPSPTPGVDAAPSTQAQPQAWPLETGRAPPPPGAVPPSRASEAEPSPAAAAAPPPSSPSSAEAAAAASLGEAFDEADPSSPSPLLEHNLLRATQLLQGGGGAGGSSAFAPSPILRLNSIRITGATALRPSFLAMLCRPYLDPSLNAQNALSNTAWNSALYGSRIEHPLPFQPTTLPSIMNLTGSIVEDLTKFDIFNSIDATLAPSMAPGATEEDVDVVLSCSPKGRIFLKSSTDVGNGEGSASVQGRLRNVFGGAETLQGSATFGTRTKQAFNLQFAAPILANPDHTLSLTAFSSERDLTAFSSAFESLKGLKAALSSTVAPGTQHEVAYEASMRSLGRLLPDVSISMRKLATQPTVKSSLSHTLVRDTRDDPVLPSSGSYFKLMQEWAGFGGDASYYKAETEVSLGRRWTMPRDLLDRVVASFASRRQGSEAETPSPFLKEEPLPADLPAAVEQAALPAEAAFAALPTSTLTFRAGMLRTLTGVPSLYSDRFQLGGPTCVRMFRLNGLGPKDKLDSLGGDAYWSLGVGTNFHIPKRQDWPLKIHTFANAGQMVQLDMAKPLDALPASLSPLLQPSASAGIGLVYLQGPLRVELNAGLPLLARRSDSMRKGLQLGVGISFL